jgi:hypothetical protein
METIIDNAYEFLWDRLKYQTEAGFSGGQHRAYSGKTTELFVDNIITLFKGRYPTLDIEVRDDRDKIKVMGKDGKTYTQESVDRHVYINGKLELIIECKTYLDKCYLQRATDDARLVRKGVPHPIQAWVISLENALSDMAYNFFMYQDDEIYVNECFFLTHGKRSSAAPLYKNNNYQSRLNKEKIQKLIESFDHFFQAYQ